MGSAGQPWERRPATRGFAVVAECLLRSRGREKDRPAGRSRSVPKGVGPNFPRALNLQRGFHAPRAKRNRARGWNRGEDVHAHASPGASLDACGGRSWCESGIDSFLPFFPPFSLVFLFASNFADGNCASFGLLDASVCVCVCVCMGTCVYVCVCVSMSERARMDTSFGCCPRGDIDGSVVGTLL